MLREFSTIPTVEIIRSGSFCSRRGRSGNTSSIFSHILTMFWHLSICISLLILYYKQIELPSVCLFVRQIQIQMTIMWNVFFRKSSLNRVHVQLNHHSSQITCTNWSFCCAKVVQWFKKLCNENKKLTWVSVNLVLVYLDHSLNSILYFLGGYRTYPGCRCGINVTVLMEHPLILFVGLNKTDQIEAQPLEYGWNKKAIRTDGLLA